MRESKQITIPERADIKMWLSALSHGSDRMDPYLPAGDEKWMEEVVSAFSYAATVPHYPVNAHTVAGCLLDRLLCGRLVSVRSPRLAALLALELWYLVNGMTLVAPASAVALVFEKVALAKGTASERGAAAATLAATLAGPLIPNRGLAGARPYL